MSDTYCIDYDDNLADDNDDDENNEDDENDDDNSDAMSFFNRLKCTLKLKLFRRHPNPAISTKSIEL